MQFHILLFQSIVAHEKQTPEIFWDVSQGNPDPSLMQLSLGLVGPQCNVLSPVQRSCDRTSLDTKVSEHMLLWFLPMKMYSLLIAP